MASSDREGGAQSDRCRRLRHDLTVDDCVATAGTFVTEAVKSAFRILDQTLKNVRFSSTAIAEQSLRARLTPAG
jgi:hypothetical protein